ncbi:MAG: hypothetical protein DME19_07535 [Verrucomicrobia bacterium]|nr:MAG: hypothetical protein DME19_07535 [Verrucomicrobiota bacterium]
MGEHIIGSTGSPTNFYGQGIEFGGTNSLSNLRFAWLSTALEPDQNGVLNLADVQFVNCRAPLYGHGQTTFNVENALCSSSQALIESGPLALSGWHLTLDQCNLVGSVVPSATLFLTNSILAAVGDWGFASTNRSVDNATVATPNSFGASTDPFPFQTVGAGGHYLAPLSPFRGVGTININLALLARLSRKTTYPPQIITTNFTGNTTLAPVAPRNTELPDLGFHYDMLDYAWSGLTLTNATLTLTNGVGVAIYGLNGITLQNGAVFVSQGTANNLNRLVRYQTVQEQATTNWTGSASSLMNALSPTTLAHVKFQFTDISLMAGSCTGTGRTL